MSADPGRGEILSVESNEQKEAARALEMLHVQLISAVIDPYSWKWVVLATHHTLQSFMIASLDRFATLPSGLPQRIAARGGGGITFAPSPAQQDLDVRADDLAALYEQTKRATGFRPALEVERDLTIIREARDLFVRTMPARWELHYRSLPGTVQSCMQVVAHLGWNPGHIAWERAHLLDLAKMKHLAAMKILEALERQYAA